MTIRPEEGTHGKVSLAGQVAVHRQTILCEKTVELPLRHVLVVLSAVPWVVKGHLEVTCIHLSALHDLSEAAVRKLLLVS